MHHITPNTMHPASCQRLWPVQQRALAARCPAVASRAAEKHARRPKIVHIPSFLPAAQFARVLAEARALAPQLRNELNCIAKGRRGCYVPSNSAIVAAFSSKAVAVKLQQALQLTFPLELSEFPVELREYPRGAEMPWHLDEQMFSIPQWELIFTLENSSDSRTEWRDDRAQQHSMWTAPNSMLCVEAEGWQHRVLPVRSGSRTILKMAFHPTGCKKLPAFEANLGRDAWD